MRLISVNVGKAQQVLWRGRTVRTAIFKLPVDGPVEVRELGLAGDRQADLRVHGGPDKAVYAYPSEHYEYWKEELPDVALVWGNFGENFTTEGLLESDLRAGDRLQIGTATLMVTTPRQPCYKLQVRFDRADMTRRFLASGRSGFYLRVIAPGEVSAGSAICRLP